MLIEKIIENNVPREIPRDLVRQIYPRKKKKMRKKFREKKKFLGTFRKKHPQETHSPSSHSKVLRQAVHDVDIIAHAHAHARAPRSAGQEAPHAPEEGVRSVNTVRVHLKWARNRAVSTLGRRERGGGGESHLAPG